jgi:hypothetical protein
MPHLKTAYQDSLRPLPNNITTSGVLTFVPPQGSKVPEFHMINVYRHLYSFYSNGGSCLDRLGVELVMLYKLPAGTKPDFGCLYGKGGPTSVLRSPSMKTLFNSPNAAICHEFMQYRHRHIHDGLVRIYTGGGQMYLPEMLSDGKLGSSYVNMEQTCKAQFAAVESFIDEAYRTVWADLQKQGKPPL